jgi:hypothetical protein
VLGINDKAIRFFIDEVLKELEESHVGGAVHSKQKLAILSMDATDIHANIRLTQTAGVYGIVGGEAAGLLTAELGLSDCAALETALNDHALSLEKAIDAGENAYPKVDREVLLHFLSLKMEALSSAVTAAEASLTEATLKYHERNGGEFEKGRQKTMNQERWRKKQAAMAAVRACNEAIVALSSALPLVGSQLVCILEALKVVIVALVVASTHYAVVFISSPSGKLVVPAARIFHDKVDNAACVSLLHLVSQTVSELSDGKVVVAAHTYDGAQRTNRFDSAQALAVEAKEHVNAVVSAAPEGQSALARALRTVALCDAIIADTRACPPRPALCPGGFHVAKAKVVAGGGGADSPESHSGVPPDSPAALPKWLECNDEFWGDIDEFWGDIDEFASEIESEREDGEGLADESGSPLIGASAELTLRPYGHSSPWKIWPLIVFSRMRLKQ